MVRLRVGVVGVGHLGKEHARILASLPEVELVGVVDRNPEQAELIAGRCQTRAYTDHRPLLSLVDAAVIAVPTSYHCEVARDFLQERVPLLIEKPFALDVQQADLILSLAEQHQTLVQIGHIERFNPTFEELLRRPLQPRYLRCERCSPFSGRSTDVGVVLDLMIHDLDLVLALVQAPVHQVEAFGVAVLGGHEDLAQARVTFANGTVADFFASRVNPSGSRTMQVWGVEGFAALDFTRRNLRLIMPDPSLREGMIDSRRLDPVTLARLKSELFGGFLHVAEVHCESDQGDQLTREIREFVHCLQTGQQPRVDGRAGREALALANQVLSGMQAHRWDNSANLSRRGNAPTAPQASLAQHGAVGGVPPLAPLVGPHHLPTPRGPLFSLPPKKPQNPEAA